MTAWMSSFRLFQNRRVVLLLAAYTHLVRIAFALACKQAREADAGAVGDCGACGVLCVCKASPATFMRNCSVSGLQPPLACHDADKPLCCASNACFSLCA